MRTVRIKNGVVEEAIQKPLGNNDEPAIDPDVLIFHTIAGTLAGAYAVFHAQGYYGPESSLAVGGPWDGASQDGIIWQFQNLKRQADAQWDGNAYADSVETSDGGNPAHPWSSEQLETLIAITVAWCREYDNPCRLVPVTGPVGKGLGWHRRRPDWNKDGHVCPGPVREAQLRTIVIPKARAILEGKEVPSAPKPKPGRSSDHTDNNVDVDGVFGHETVGALQHDLKHHGVYHDKVDGLFGPNTRAALQTYLKRKGFYGGRIDSVVGAKTIKALQRYLDVTVDGHWDGDTTRALQRALNRGRF